MAGCQEIVLKFKMIRDLAPQDVNPEVMWEGADAIRKLAQEILAMLWFDEPYPAQVQNLSGNDVQQTFRALHECARHMAEPSAEQCWRSACEQILGATRRVQELLGQSLRVEVLPDRESNVSHSVGFTHPTKVSHPQNPLLGSFTGPTSTEAETLDSHDFPEVMAGRETEVFQIQEQRLLELWNMMPAHSDHPDIAETIGSLEQVNREARDNGQLICPNEILELYRDLHGARHHLDIPEIMREFNDLGRLWFEISKSEAGD